MIILIQRLPPVMDDFGRVLAEAPPDDFQSRVGIAMALKAISPDLPTEDIETLFTFFLPDALCDPSLEVNLIYSRACFSMKRTLPSPSTFVQVRNKMLEAAVQAVNDHGKDTTSTLLPIFENFLRQVPFAVHLNTAPKRRRSRVFGRARL